MLKSALPQATAFSVQSGDVKLAAKEYGDKANPTLVLVHGYPDCSTVWDRMLPHLAGDYHVVTYDVRGCGDSDAPKKVRDYKMPLLINDLIAVLDAIDKPRVHLVAHDWGSIQLWNAVQDQRLKDRVASYTSASGISFDHAGLWMRRQFASGKLNKAFGQLFKSWYMFMFQIPGLAEVAWKRRLADGWHKMLKRSDGVDVEKSPTQLKDGCNGIQLYRANFFKHMFLPAPNPVICPVQIVVLQNDPFVSPDLFSLHKEFVPQLWRRDIVSAHWMPLSQPERLAGFVKEFVHFHETGQSTPALDRAKRRAEKSDMQLGGKLALVTGGGSGIGRCAALDLAREGADLLLADINEDAAHETAEMVRALGAQALVKHVDVGSLASLEELAAYADEVAGPVEIVLNNAGIGMGGSFLGTTADAWERIININVNSVLHGSRLFGQRMVDQGLAGHIANTASAAAFTASRTFPAYATTKAAVLMATDCLRAEMDAYNIGVTVLCPGFADTNIAKTTEYVDLEGEDQDAQRAKADAAYKKRNLQPETVSAALIKGIKKNKPRVLVGAEAHFFNFVTRYLPGLARKFAKLDLGG